MTTCTMSDIASAVGARETSTQLDRSPSSAASVDAADLAGALTELADLMLATPPVGQQLDEVAQVAVVVVPPAAGGIALLPLVVDGENRGPLNLCSTQPGAFGQAERDGPRPTQRTPPRPRPGRTARPSRRRSPSSFGWRRPSGVSSTKSSASSCATGVRTACGVRPPRQCVVGAEPQVAGHCGLRRGGP